MCCSCSITCAEGSAALDKPTLRNLQSPQLSRMMVCCVCRNCQAGWPAWPGTKGVVFHACHTATSKRTTDEQINSRHSSALPSAHLCTGTQTREQFIASLSNILKRIFKETEREGVDWINLVQDRGKKRAAVNTE